MEHFALEGSEVSPCWWRTKQGGKESDYWTCGVAGNRTSNKCNVALCLSDENRQLFARIAKNITVNADSILMFCCQTVVGLSDKDVLVSLLQHYDSCCRIIIATEQRKQCQQMKQVVTDGWVQNRTFT